MTGKDWHVVAVDVVSIGKDWYGRVLDVGIVSLNQLLPGSACMQCQAIFWVGLANGFTTFGCLCRARIAYWSDDWSASATQLSFGDSQAHLQLVPCSTKWAQGGYLFRAQHTRNNVA